MKPKLFYSIGRFLLALSLAMILAGQHSFAASAEADNSIRLISIDEVAYDHITYTVEVKVTSDFAAAGYGIGIEYSTDSSFRQGNNRPVYIGRDWSGTYDYSDTSRKIQITRYSVNLVPQTHYWIRPLLIPNGSSMNSPAATGSMLEFDGPDSDASYTNLILDQPHILNSFTDSWLHGKFTAPENGFYALAGYSEGSTSDFDFVAYVMPQAMGYGTTGKAQNNPSNPLSIYRYLLQGETIYFFAYSTVNSDTVKVVSGDTLMPHLSLDVPMYARNAEVVFIAPNAGWYDFHFADQTDVQGYIRTLNPSNGNWDWIGMSFVQYLGQGEKLYVRPDNNTMQNGDLNPLVVTQAVMPSDNSIEGGSAMNVSNVSAVFPVRMNLTEQTIRNGYRFGILYGEEPDPSKWHDSVRSGPAKYDKVYTWTNWSHTGKFFPGQHIYFQAAIFDASTNGVIISDPNIYELNLVDNVDGMIELQIDQPFPWSTTNVSHFYFVAPEDGMYAVTGSGMISTRLATENNQFLGVLSEQSDYLMGAYAKAGQKLYLNVFNDMANNCSITVTNGLGVLPSVAVDTPLVFSEVAPVSFQALETGNYRFSLDSSQAQLMVLDETGTWQTVGCTYDTPVLKGQTLWLRRTSGDGSSVTLTAQKLSDFTKLTFPAALTDLQDEACMGLPIQEAVFGSDIQTIGNRAFADCTNLVTVLIPNGAVTIAADAFDGCTSVTVIAPTGGAVETFVKAQSNLHFQEIGS